MPKMDMNAILKYLPKYDCSICGNPTCEAMARRIFNDKQSPCDCVLLEDKDKNEIIQILDNRPEKSKNDTIKERTVELQPCAEYGRVTLESTLHRPKDMYYHELFAPCEMCALFQDIPLEKARCSKVMGYAYSELGEKAIHVFNTGRIIIRRAEDHKDAISTLDKLSNILWPAVVCSCGSPFTDCLGGACVVCSSISCSALAWGAKEHEFSNKTLGALLKNSKTPLIAEAFQSLDNLVIELEKSLLDSSKPNGDHLIKKRRFFQSILQELIKIGNKGMYNSTNLEKNLEFVAIHAIERNFRRIIEAIFESIEKYETDSINYYYSYVKDGYKALKENDSDYAKKVLKKYDSYLEEHQFGEYSWNEYKLMRNGSNLARACIFSLSTL